MMKQSWQKFASSGVVFGVMVIFFGLIGFTYTAASLIMKIGGNEVGLGQTPTYFSLLIFLGFLGIWNGWRAANQSRHPGGEFKLSEMILAGAVAGVVAGLLVFLYSLVVGSFNQNGVDMRGYLASLSPQSISFFVFGQSAVVGGLIHLGYSTLTAILGAVLVFGFDRIRSQLNTWQTRAVQWSQQNVIHRVQSNPFLMYIFLGVVLLLLILLPRSWGSYWNYIMGTVGIYVLLGLGLNIIVGLSGQLVLGYVAFFAIGAYTFALSTAPEPHNLQLNFWLAILLAIVVSAISGILIGLPILRLRGDYLAIVTLGFGEIIRILLRSDWLKDFTLGPRGVRDIAGPTLFGRAFLSDIDFMYLIILAVLLTLFLAKRLQESNVGRAWLAINQDETVAQATGVDTYKYKLLALAIGAAFAGLGGAIFASRNQFTGPEDHVLMVSINVLCIVIVGGMGSLPGVVLGSFVLKGLPEILRELEIYRLLAFGALLVVMMIIRPEGLWPASRPALEVDEPKVEVPPDKKAIPITEGGG